MISQPQITGISNSEKLEQIERYLQQVVDELNEMPGKISTDNLGQTLRGKIENGITEHQDVSFLTDYGYLLYLIFKAILGGL